MNSLVIEKAFHHPVARLAAGLAVDFLDQFESGSLGLLHGVLAVLPIVVVGIRTYIHVLQQPVDAKAL